MLATKESIGLFVALAAGSGATASPGVPVDPDRGYGVIFLEPQNYDSSVPAGLNDLGDVVGYDYALSFNPEQLAWVWRNGVFTQLPAPRSNSIATDINNAGIITGQAFNNLGFDTVGCFWGFDGQFQALSTQDATPLAVTDNFFNAFAGVDRSGASDQPAIIVLGAAGALGLLPGTDQGAAVDLNSGNDVVGYVVDAQNDRRAVYWPGTGAPVAVPTPLEFGEARGINEDGTIVGYYRVGSQTSTAQNRGFRFKPGVGFATLSSAALNLRSEANAISDNLVTVGGSQGPSDEEWRRGTVWDLTTGYLLDDLAPRRNFIEIAQAIDINAGGEIVARGIEFDAIFGFGERAVLLYPKNGKVEFGPSAYTPTPADPRGVIAEDFDNDGDPDVAVVSQADGLLQIYRNDGSGGLTLAETVATTGEPLGLRAMDLNNDGRLDLVVGSDEGVGVAMNQGGLQFGTPGGSFFDAAPFGWYAAPADINGDAFTDVAVAQFFGDQVAFYTNNGTGRLSLAFTRDVGLRPRYIDSGDLNGDGKPDVVTGNQFDGITVILSNASGYDSTPDAYDEDVDTSWVKIADMNNDGAADIVALRVDSLGVYYNRGSGSFFPSRDSFEITQYFGLAPRGLELEDMDMDGDPDLVAGVGSSRFVRTLLNRGSGVMMFEDSTSVLNDGRLGGMDVADMDGDGRPDVVVSDSDTGRLAVVLSDAIPPQDVLPGCNPADLAPPYDTLDLGDVTAFTGGFTGQDSIADVAEPFGVLDLADIGLFIDAFSVGCP